MNKGRIVIVAYKPFPGKESDLLQLAKSHVQILEREDLVTDRKPVIMQAADGTVVEVFEWQSSEAMQAAHANPVVLQIWQQYAEVCSYVPIAEVEEAGQLFSEFTPVN